MRSVVTRLTIAVVALLCLAPAAQADIKIKSRNTFGGQSTGESTVYIKGKRQRAENPGGMNTITQCDLRRTLQLNSTTKTYIVTPFEDGEAEEGASSPQPSGNKASKPEPARRGGVVTMTATMTDTGERKQMFGFTARRIKTSMVTESSPDACQQVKSRIDTDGWYIDLNVEFDCYEGSASTYAHDPQQAGGCRDRYRTKRVGTAKLGYPVHVTTTMYDESGKVTGTFTQEVLEISKATLDPALFDVPSDYRLAKDFSEMYSMSALMKAAREEAGDDDDDGDDDGAPSKSSSGMRVPAANPSANAATSEALGPKRPGVLRIGVVTPKASAGDGINPDVLAGAVRETLMQSLAGATVEVVGLPARTPMQVEAEARQKECDFVVHTTVAHKKGGGGGGFGGFLKKAAPIVGDVAPVAGSASGRVGAHVAAGVVYTAADVAASVKAKDELTLEYALQQVGGAALLADKVKAKAKSDGEDLITQLAQQAASAILAATAKR